MNVGAAGAAAGNAAANENGNYFGQLLAAGMITGMDGTAPVAFGNAYPTAPVGGGLTVGDTRTGVTQFDITDFRPGQYIVLNGIIGAVADGSGVLTPQQAANIDRRLDDGLASAGSLLGQDTAGNCKTAAGDNEYAAAVDDVCAIAYRLN